MVATDHIWIKLQPSGKEILYRLIRVTLDASKQLDPGLSQRILCSAPNPSADQNIYAMALQESSQRSMSAPVGIHYLRMRHGSVVSFVKLELFRMPKMLEYFSVFIGYCNLHESLSFLR